VRSRAAQAVRRQPPRGARASASRRHSDDDDLHATRTARFHTRGRHADETLRAFKAFWIQNTPQSDGEFVRSSGIGLAPKPVQEQHPPTWVGGDRPARSGASSRSAMAATRRRRHPRTCSTAHSSPRPDELLGFSLAELPGRLLE
jgi:alkanesulfonate monooxygenase SsuD/methylene tetrahydromethanopterin reductase-like flavin-dependent oxidoreductase (luciferase family)